MNKGELYDWIFHYNHYTEKWSAVKRENYNALFSDRKNVNVLSSSEIETLIKLISRTGGNPSKIKDLINQKQVAEKY